VKSFVKSNKNDFLDAEAIARKNMRFVSIKTDDQLDLQALHRMRDLLIALPDSRHHQLRAFPPERGMTFASRSVKTKSSPGLCDPD